MKICSFCNTENEDNVVKCASCGANSFKYKCSNCGAIFSEGVHCPHCGVKIGQQSRVCPKCNTQYYSAACPTCGYIPHVNETTAATPYHNSVQPVQPKRKTWLWVLGWVFIFPLPLTLILIKKPDIDKKIKYGIIAAAWVVYLLIGIVGGATNNKESKAVKQIDVEETTAVTEVPTVPFSEKETEAEPTEPPTAKPTHAPTEAPTPIVFISYTDYVDAGATATVTIQGKPNTDYIIYVYYDTTESKADGLEPKTADDSGYVTWEWKVGTNTSKGEHSITVRGGGASETVRFTVG